MDKIFMDQDKGSLIKKRLCMEVNEDTRFILYFLSGGNKSEYLFLSIFSNYLFLNLCI